MEKAQKAQKANIILLCECCGFSCITKKDLNRHLLTAKHKKNSNDNEKSPKSKITFNCINCNKKFNDNAGLWRHKKKCVSRYETDEPGPEPETKQEPNNEIINLLIVENNKQLQDNNKQLQDNNTRLHDEIN